jgi:hypothetical protein
MGKKKLEPSIAITFQWAFGVHLIDLFQVVFVVETKIESLNFFGNNFKV